MKKVEQNTLPLGWELVRIEQIAQIKGGKRLPKGSSFADRITEFPYIRVSDFTDNGTIDTSGLRYIERDVYSQICNYTITSTDLYISIAGTIGKTGIIPKLLDGANLTENAVKLVYLDRSKVNNRFIYYFTQSSSFIEQAGLATKAVAMPKLAINRLAKIKVPLPLITEQQKIVQQLDDLYARINKAIQLTEENLQHLQHLLPAAMNQVFEGAEIRGWTDLKLKDSIRLINGRAYSKNELLIDSSLTPIIRIQNLNGGNDWYYSDMVLDENKYCDKGDLLFAWSTTFGPYIWKGTKSIFHYHIWKLELSKNINKEFAYYYLLHLTDEIKAKSHGVTMVHITKAKMEEWAFPLPDLKTQFRIVEYLKSIHTKKDVLEQKLKQKLEHFTKLKSSLLDAAYKGELVTSIKALETVEL